LNISRWHQLLHPLERSNDTEFNIPLATLFNLADQEFVWLGQVAVAKVELRGERQKGRGGQEEEGIEEWLV